MEKLYRFALLLLLGFGGCVSSNVESFYSNEITKSDILPLKVEKSYFIDYLPRDCQLNKKPDSKLYSNWHLMPDMFANNIKSKISRLECPLTNSPILSIPLVNPKWNERMMDVDSNAIYLTLDEAIKRKMVFVPGEMDISEIDSLANKSFNEGIAIPMISFIEHGTFNMIIRNIETFPHVLTSIPHSIRIKDAYQFIDHQLGINSFSDKSKGTFGKIKIQTFHMNWGTNDAYFYASLLTLFTANLVGFPIASHTDEIKIISKIYDNNNQLIDEFTATAEETCYAAFFWGHDGLGAPIAGYDMDDINGTRKSSHIKAVRSALAKINDHLAQNATMINSKLKKAIDLK